ncbi:hypothetical protein PIB30_044255 [Stylosanthes scabra]|uniref:Transposase (Putative), gypsy type n=1 Tax=Stylosanthes scabra TaxID=79078 RepID=A0ABU6ZEJ8_9FABA|nr:hypothetical protein [Stylosanthes scabra]
MGDPRRIRGSIHPQPEYLDELKGSGVLFGGGDLERRYRVEAASPNERVCFLNLSHPRVPNWLWVNEVMFTEFGIQVPFTDFQQCLLNRTSIVPSQLHPNAWSAIRGFELVTNFLELPQDPEVFLYLFSFFSPNTKGKTKKGYMSVRPQKGNKIFGLYEDSFHDFKRRYFKIFPVGEHRPFWLSLEGQGGFPSYWSFDAGLDYVPVTYRRLNADQWDTADILVHLFNERNLNPKAVIGRPSEARSRIVRIAGQDVTLARLCHLIRPGGVATAPGSNPGVVGPNLATSGPSSVGRTNSNNMVEISSPDQGKGELAPRNESLKRPADQVASASKRQRSDGAARDFSLLDRSFDAFGFIASHMLVPKAQEVLKDFDPVESLRWVQSALLRSATVMKSVEPRLTMINESERRNLKLVGDLKVLNQEKVAAEAEKVEAVKSKDEEIEHLRGREKDLGDEVKRLQSLVADEKARADLA